MLLAVGLHDTYILPLAIFLLFYFFRNTPNLIHIVFYSYIISFILSDLNLDFVSNIIDSSGIIRQQRKGYLDLEYAEEVIESKEAINFYAKYKFQMINTLITGSYIWLYFRRFSLLKHNKEVLHFSLISLIIITFVNFVDNIPSMARFYTIGYMSFAAALYIFFSSYNFVRRPEWYRVLTLFIANLFSLLAIWDGFTCWTLATILSNPFTFWLFDYEKSINAIIKSFIF
jgi:hypothetical protein